MVINKNKSTKPVIQIKEMHKWFGNFHVLKNISLGVNQGVRIVICGPSGSGKSTLIRCINRLEVHQQGDIIVNTFIGLYKDTTLVVVIGLLDPLGIGRAALADTKWNGLSTETYLFVALFFFVSCFAMSRYSLWLENKLNTDQK